MRVLESVFGIMAVSQHIRTGLLQTFGTRKEIITATGVIAKFSKVSQVSGDCIYRIELIRLFSIIKFYFSYLCIVEDFRQNQ